MADSMHSLNKVMLIGNVGRAPEMRFTPSGTPTTQFSVATTRRRQAPDGTWMDETDWHNIVTWDKLAERVNNYIQKGNKVYVEGRIQTRSWEGQDGQKRYRTEIVAYDVKNLTPRAREDGGGPAPAGEPDDFQRPNHDEESAEDLPF